MSEFERALKRKIKGYIPIQAFIGSVVSVDETDYTCEVTPITNSDTAIADVRLKPTIDSVKKGTIAIPAVGSFVIVGLLSNDINSAFVIWCSNITKYCIVTESGTTLEFKDDGTIEINGNTDAGLVKVNVLKAQMTVLQNEINTLKTAIGTAIAVYSGALDSGASATTFNAVVLPQIDLSAIENTKVKHGG